MKSVKRGADYISTFATAIDRTILIFAIATAFHTSKRKKLKIFDDKNE